MTLVFMDGFDRYITGTSTTSYGGSTALLNYNGWGSNSGLLFSPSLNGVSGYSLEVASTVQLFRNLPSNMSHVIIGFRFKSDFVNQTYFQLRDAGAAQCTFCVENGGSVNVRSGGPTGTIIAQSAAGRLLVGSVHHIEFDITIGTSAAVAMYVDTILVASGTGNTRAGTANSYVNYLFITNAFPPTADWLIDDFYILDANGTTNNAPLQTAPRIDTAFPSSDTSVQFGFGAGQLGASKYKTASAAATSTANSIILMPVRPLINCTINSISIFGIVTNASQNLRGVIYNDSAGTPNALMSSGTTVVGVTANTVMTLPLTTPQNLVAGTTYHIGFMMSVGIGSWMYQLDFTTQWRTGTATFASGAPATAPAMSLAIGAAVWGNITNPGLNWYEVSQLMPMELPTPGQSYLTSNTVGQQDLFGFPALSGTTIYAVNPTILCNRGDAGNRTVAARLRSGATTVGGAAQTPSTVLGYMNTYLETDPIAGGAWTAANLNAMSIGYRIET